MSLASQNELSIETARPVLARLLNRSVDGLERIGGGRNSQVYRVDAGDGERFALKVYFRHPADKRDRLATEFGSFTHLWQNGVREVPEPLACEPERGWAIYHYIEGEKIPPGQAGEVEVVAAANFLGSLRSLAHKNESRQLGTASEAFFAVGQTVENVRQRLAALQRADDASPAGRELRDFLATGFEPLLARVVPWSEGRLRAAGVSFAEELDLGRRTLSPSDFGFHNALRQRDGRIIFLDFEYFGWDDAAKMISDFLLHPAMDLPVAAKKRFASTMFANFADWPGLRGRVEAVYPLFGLKWCMILLNEFRPDQMARRQFAATVKADCSDLQLAQIGKARQMLNRIKSEFENFPYHG